MIVGYLYIVSHVNVYVFLSSNTILNKTHLDSNESVNTIETMFSYCFLTCILINRHEFNYLFGKRNEKITFVGIIMSSTVYSK